MTESLRLFSNSLAAVESGSVGTDERKPSPVFEQLGCGRKWQWRNRSQKAFTCFRTVRLLVKAAVVEESQKLSPVFEQFGCGRKRRWRNE
ncbi:hypothetical protein [Bacteroides pyogenes]|uniref:hypothetical protein n=1 Tax=Bacteroides pyogenes TaxID=310300 RepID=UPI001BAD52C0|nr:hypothetical protein [Bacteroides pyogenes]